MVIAAISKRDRTDVDIETGTGLGTSAGASAGTGADDGSFVGSGRKVETNVRAEMHMDIYKILSKGEKNKDIEMNNRKNGCSSGEETMETKKIAMQAPNSFVKSETVERPVIRRLKSSLKLSKSHSTSSVTTSSSTGSSQKNVRFAVDLTTVKKFDSNAEPMSISNENSPTLYPLMYDDDFEHGVGHKKHTNLCYEDDLYNDDSDAGDNDEGFWFSKLPNLKTLNRGFNGKKNKLGAKNRSKSEENLKSLTNFQLNYSRGTESDDNEVYDHRDDYEDDDTDVEDIDYKEIFKLDHQFYNAGSSTKLFEVLDWKLVNSNVSCFKRKISNPFILASTDFNSDTELEGQIFEFLQGSNIRLHALNQCKEDDGKFYGLIFVNNLHFEKFIEIKFSFNDWKDIHYVTAGYFQSITNRIDEFKFIIDLNSLKYSLKVKNLIFADKDSPTTLCPLKVDLCCRYDVNNETFYDNNNYENYQMNLVSITKPLFINYQTTEDLQNGEKSGKPENERLITHKDDDYDNNNNNNNNNNNKISYNNSFARNFLFTTTLSHSHGVLDSNINNSRSFNDNTDYYNTSPLKHLYHNDPSLIKPARLNEVLINPDLSSTDEEENIALKNEHTNDDNNTSKSLNIVTTTTINKEISNEQNLSSLNDRIILDSRSGSLSSLESCLSSYTTSSLSSSISSSSSSGEYSPEEDLNVPPSYQSLDSISSIDLAQFNYLPPISHLECNFGNSRNDQSATPNFDQDINDNNNGILENHHSELYDDRQSVITDIVGEQTINANNSTDTLINPNSKPISSSSIEPIMMIPNSDTNKLSILSGQSKDNKNGSHYPNSNTNTRESKDFDYQSFLNSYCFYASPTKRVSETNKLASNSKFSLDSSSHKEGVTLSLDICNNGNQNYENNHSSYGSDNLNLLGTSPPILSQGSHWSL